MKKKKKANKSIIAIKEQRAAYIFLIPALLGLTFITYLPLLAALGVGLTDLRVSHFFPNAPSPEFVGMSNFVEIFKNPMIDFGDSIRITVFFALFAVVSSVIYSMIIAMLLNRKMPGRGFFRSVFYIPYILPAAAVMIGWSFLMDPTNGVVNYLLTQLGLPTSLFFASSTTVIPTIVMISVWTSGNLIVIFLAGLQNVPRVYQEAAEIDGAGFFQRLRHITIPCMTPIIFYNILMSLVVNIQVVIPSLSITKGGPGRSSMFMTFLMYNEAFRGGRLGRASAIAFVFFIISAILAAILFITSKSWIFYEGGDDKK